MSQGLDGLVHARESERLGGPRDRRDFPRDQGPQNRDLAVEVKIDRALGDARLARDIVHPRGIETVRYENRQGRVADFIGAVSGAALPFSLPGRGGLKSRRRILVSAVACLVYN